MRPIIRVVLRASGACALALPAVAWAQTGSGDAAQGPDIVVTGSRATPRIATETSAPVDSFKGDDLLKRGQGDLNNALLTLEPSLNFGNAVYGGAAANARGPSLRGLAQDQVLVLVDGKRWHGSSLINFNNTLGRGEVPWDFNMIPVSAIERVEVLRDGAAAQYGSDAIGGVINVILRDTADSGALSAQVGVTDRGDGFYDLLRAGGGFRLGGGTVRLSAEMQNRDSVNRAAVDTRYRRVTNQQGELDSTNINLGAALRWPVGADGEIYLDGLYGYRKSSGAVRFRDPGVSPLFPNGFLPIVGVRIDDFSAVAGIRGTLLGTDVDLSNTFGANRADFTNHDTVNTDLGINSPTVFDGGGARYMQNVVDLNLHRGISVLEGLSIAAGAEYRREGYRLRKGEPASFTGAGASGAAGFNPARPVDVRRDAVSAFIDTELSITSTLRVGGAVRHEHYDDFGDKTVWKASLFFKPLRFLAVRGTASSGFRAPSLQQQYFSLVRSQAVTGVIETTGTYAATDPISRAVGASALRPERSRNISGGVVLTPMPLLNLSVDYYRVSIDDRIALSEALPRSNPAVAAALVGAGITNVQSVSFFTNAVDTTTEGFEVTAAWTQRFESGSALNINLAYNRSKTKLDRLRANATVPALPLLGGRSLILLLNSKPENRATAGINWSSPLLDVTVDVNRFGGFLGFANAVAQTFAASTTIDASITFHAGRAMDFSLGVLNLTNQYPDELIDRASTQGGSIVYPEAGSLGIRGREYYARATLRF